VPVVMVSGDEQAVSEVAKLTGNVEGAVVKRFISFHAAAVVDISRFPEFAISYRADRVS